MCLFHIVVVEISGTENSIAQIKNTFMYQEAALSTNL